MDENRVGARVPGDEAGGVSGLVRDAVEVALLEAHRLAGEDVDRRYDQESAGTHRARRRSRPRDLVRALVSSFGLRCHVNMLTSDNGSMVSRPATSADWSEMAKEQSHSWASTEIRDLFETILALRNLDEAERFFRDLCTIAELEAMAHRWQVARLVDEGLPYHEVSRRTGASTTTVTRVAHWLRHGEEGYRLALDRGKRRSAG